MRIEARRFQAGEQLKSLTPKAVFRSDASSDPDLRSAAQIDEALVGLELPLSRVRILHADGVPALGRNGASRIGWQVRHAALFRNRRTGSHKSK